MLDTYALFLHRDAASCFHSLQRGEKEKVRRFLDLLEQRPHTTGETTERDEVGRSVQVKLVGRLKIIFWADHAVKQIKVLRIERLKRG